MITDLSYLKSLASDDESFIRDMINIFNEQIEEYKTEMPVLLENADYDKLSMMAHKAKSSVAVMGMSAEAEILQKLEIMAKSGDGVDRYGKMIEQILEKMDAAIDELEQAYP